MTTIPEKAFLDTSVIILREFGTDPQKAEISKALSGMLKYTTTYVKMELNLSLIKDAVFLHSLMNEEMDLKEVFRRLQGFPLTERRRKRCLTLLSRISNKRRLSLVEAIIRLENLIYTLHNILLGDINMIISGTKCPLAEVDVRSVMLYKDSLSCTKERPVCMIQKYLRDNKKNLEKLYGDISSIHGLHALRTLLAKVIKDPRVAKGRNCNILGDTIICLDAPSEQKIFSIDIKHFEPICRSLGKSFIRIKLASPLRKMTYQRP